MFSRLAVPSIIFAVVWGLTTHGKFSVTGDEPHYLMMSQSLLVDGDLDLRNNYEGHEGRVFGSPGLEPELHARLARNGHFMSVHDIGLPIVLLPVYAVATVAAREFPAGQLARFRMTPGLFAYSVVSLAILGLFCVSAGVTCAALRRRGNPSRAAALLVISVWLTAPVLSNSFLVFPEALAIAVTAWVVHACSRTTPGWTRSDWVIVAVLGCLPWVHRKYAAYAAALFFMLIWSRRQQFRGRSSLAAAITMYALPQIALAVWTYRYWGNLSGPVALERLPFSWDDFLHGLFGTFVDRENGLLWWAPAYMLLPAAWWLGERSLRIWAVPIAALVLPGAAHDLWWGGFSPAGRFLVPAAPIVCLISATPLVRNVRLRAVAISLLLPQFAIAGYGWQRPRLLWPRGDADNRILAALAPPLNAWAPSLRVMTEHAWRRSVELLSVVAIVNVVVIGASHRRGMAVPDDGPVSPASRR